MAPRFPSISLIAAGLLLLGASNARAQQWLSDRQRAEGHGILVGDFELHPGVGAEAGYVSNVLLTDPRTGSAAVRVAPHLFLSTLGAERSEGSDQKVSLRAGLAGSFRDYFGIKNLAPNASIGQDLKLVLMPSSVFGVEFFDEYVRTVDPFTGAASPPNTNGSSLSLPRYSRDKIGAGTRINLSTPGSVFRAGLGYRFDADLYEDKVFQGNQSTAHTISSDTSWEFLPQTAVLWNGSVRLQDWSHPAMASAAGMGAPVPNRSNSTVVDTKIGVTGALTSRVGLTFAGGYSAGFFRNKNDYEGFIAQVSSRVRISDDALWMLGYDRVYGVSFIGDHMLTNRVSTSLQSTFARVLVVALRGSFALTDFGRDPTVTNKRKDETYQGNLSGEYRFTDWLALTAELGALYNHSNAQISSALLTAPNGMMLNYTPTYVQLQVWGGIRAFL